MTFAAHRNHHHMHRLYISYPHYKFRILADSLIHKTHYLDNHPYLPLMVYSDFILDLAVILIILLVGLDLVCWGCLGLVCWGHLDCLGLVDLDHED